jgi:hypothetical protein
VDALGVLGELEEFGDPADVLARNFLLIFMDVKRFVGVGVASDAPPLLRISVAEVEGRACDSELVVLSSSGAGLAA